MRLITVTILYNSRIKSVNLVHKVWLMVNCIKADGVRSTLQVWTQGMKYCSWTERTLALSTSPTWRWRSPRPRWPWLSTRCPPWNAASSATCRRAARTWRRTCTRTSSPRVKVRSAEKCPRRYWSRERERLGQMRSDRRMAFILSYMMDDWLREATWHFARSK